MGAVLAATPGMGSHPPRLKDFNYIGRHHYFLTFCTYERRRLFVTPAIVGLLRAQLLQSSSEHDVVVHAYCAMPDHVHLLVQGTSETADLRACMSHLKQRTGWRYREATGARLWQGSYYDHVLREEEGIAGVIAYIVNNPVRSGLVATPEEYPFWDSFTQGREGLRQFMKGAGEWRPCSAGLLVSP